jgi:hypothetical protein
MRRPYGTLDSDDVAYPAVNGWANVYRAYGANRRSPSAALGMTIQ